MTRVKDSLDQVRNAIVGMEYENASDVLAQYDWLDYYPVVDGDVIVDVVQANAEGYTVVKDLYMVKNA